MSYLSIFSLSFLIALSGVIPPGPVLAAVISESARHGFKAGPLIMLGHILLELCMVAVLVLGFSKFIGNSALLQATSLAGAVVLLIFGTRMIVSAKKIQNGQNSYYAQSNNLVLLGFLMSISNPHWTVWWLTVGMGLLLAARQTGAAGIAVFFAGHILADLGWYSIISFLIARGKKFISANIYKKIIIACGIAIIGFGLALAINTLSRL